MPYTPPSLVGSGITWTSVRSLGFHGTLAKVAQANGLPAPQVSRLSSSNTVAGAFTAYSSLVERFLSGDPIALVEVTTRMTDAATIFRSLAQAADDINTLISANPGTVRDVVVKTRNGEQTVQHKRTWP